MCAVGKCGEGVEVGEGATPSLPGDWRTLGGSVERGVHAHGWRCRHTSPDLCVGLSCHLLHGSELFCGIVQEDVVSVITVNETE